MKKTIQQCIGLASALLILMYVPNSSLAANKPSFHTTEFSFSVKATQNAKKHRIRIIGSGHDKVLCSVYGVAGKRYQIFVFTFDSKLVTHTTMHSGETAALNNLSKGNYMFEALLEDEKIESGQFTIK
ncbi:MAG: hypothetical protein ACHQEM_11565 [Chitinophagales bacterium]